MKRQLALLKEEETRLGRLLITKKIGEEAYDKLRNEWKAKVLRIELTIAELERESLVRVDDMDAALMLMTRLRVLYERLGDKDRSTLLQILVKQFIVNREGKVIECILNPPFAFLQNLVEELSNLDLESRSSTQIFVGAQIELLDLPVEQFFALIRFEDRESLKYCLQFTQRIHEL